tara:strand:+ start:1123 stop:1302 length:180 start_codon:yes stop_codon:yes gene_type:complete
MATKKTATVKKETTTPKWSLSQDDYIALLKSIEINSQNLLNLQNEVNRLKGRMGLGSGI